MKKEKGITLIALVVTIVILLILAGISISMLTGENGVISQASQADKKTDISGTYEQIKLDLVGNVAGKGSYTNQDVVEAVKKITGRTVDIGESTVVSKKGNDVDISDLWTSDGDSYIELDYEITNNLTTATVNVGAWYPIQDLYREYATKYIENVEDGSDMIKIYMDSYIYNCELNGKTDYPKTWAELTTENYSTVEEYYESLVADGEIENYDGGYKEWMIAEWQIGIKEFDEQAENYYITSISFESLRTVKYGDDEQKSYAEENFEVTKNGNYKITATGKNGDIKSTIVEINDLIAASSIDKPHKDQDSLNNDIGVDEDGNLVNLDNWRYTLNDSSIGLHGEIRVSSGRVYTAETGYIGEFVDGKIIGTVPCYIIRNKQIYVVTDIMCMFYNCQGLEIAPKISKKVKTLGSSAFEKCSALTSITISDSVTSIEYSAFYGCSSLTSITIPDSVTSIKNWAFYGCSSLTTVNYTGTQEEWNKITIYSDNDNLKNATINYNYKQ